MSGEARCRRCRRPLSDPFSVSRKVGPICAKKLSPAVVEEMLFDAVRQGKEAFSDLTQSIERGTFGRDGLALDAIIAAEAARRHRKALSAATDTLTPREGTEAT